MILGTGIDACEVARLQSRLDRADDGFIQAVFTPDEIAYCRGKHHPAQHFAARFAAKEAVVKALSGAAGGGSFWQDIEIRRAAGGQPEVELRGRAQQLAAELGVARIWVSMSHVPELAVASVILEGPAD